MLLILFISSSQASIMGINTSILYRRKLGKCVIQLVSDIAGVQNQMLKPLNDIINDTQKGLKCKAYIKLKNAGLLLIHGHLIQVKP